MNTTNFTEDDILKVLRKLDPDKAHGHDEISIRMIQICDKAICKPSHSIFSSCIESGIFPTEWKMANAVPIHKRDDKQNNKLSTCFTSSKFRKNIWTSYINEMCSFFTENDLISSNQSGFKQEDSCINQLLSITHDIYQYLD